ncbi:hypothetical protein CARUB_v10011050mg [Capsella rubella]|uniref:Uncharacterized protein n=1 Tax=Capsella rubella TaxID=81985 RepID=R0IK28_9BRAS|nr:hypothetical protein CARUB_v10011050mg [Capsella rubella]
MTQRHKLGRQYYRQHLISLASSVGERRVTVWWETRIACGERLLCNPGWSCPKCKTEIWCAEITFERRDGLRDLWGYVQWSKIMLTLDRWDCDNNKDSLLNSVIVTC